MLVLATVVMCVCVSADPRAAADPANRALDEILAGAVEKIEGLGWDTSKRVQNGNSDIPLDVMDSGTEGTTAETFSITSSSITGLQTLRRSGRAALNTDETVLTGTAVVDDAIINANYKVTFPGTGQAEAQTVEGEASERVSKLFADIEVNMLGGVPQSIRSYTVRSGHDSLDQATNINDDNLMGPVHVAGMRKALRQILESTMDKNMKVQINQSIHAIKNAAAAKK
ncbi:hypothetical protein Pmani_009568 [Petrolisthes manimaculis]|uniref:Secreted protein n=1 Tax=Petrolisthes manimaculis TaxID=1843537 RepID=A0AAE1Q4P1_9EUCA|nr:hypothetical protein Pmani_009568 [Petrolisthes manimaculis]